MLVIRSDQRVADMYFGEFMRIFDHLYARSWPRRSRRNRKRRKALAFERFNLRPDASWVGRSFRQGAQVAPAAILSRCVGDVMRGMKGFMPGTRERV